jgi:hypothetical protein
LKENQGRGQYQIGCSIRGGERSRRMLSVDNFFFVSVFLAVFCALRRAKRIGARLRAAPSSCRYRLRFPIFVGEKE